MPRKPGWTNGTEENTNRITLARGEAGEPFEYKLSERWKVRDDNGYRIVKPPWGYVTAIDNATQFDRNSLCEDFSR